MATLSAYEQELKEKYVENEEIVKVGQKTYVCVLSIKGGYEHIGHSTDNSLNNKFTDDELKNKACKAAYESLEKYDRFHEAFTKVSGAI